MKQKIFRGFAVIATALIIGSTVNAKVSQYEETYFYLNDGTQVSTPNCSGIPSPNCAQKFYRDSPSEEWQPVMDGDDFVYVTGIRLD
ncbi:MAG TPA: hypothetical protein VNQ55_06570 [Parapedobacter sp.]|nr:hypothetical protein [Parapedobacter sp.]